jgi:hypothetical protein
MTQAFKTEFKGIRDDIGDKHISDDYFYYARNFDNGSIVGADKTLCPERTVLLTSYDDTLDENKLKEGLLFNTEIDTPSAIVNVVDSNVTYQSITRTGDYFDFSYNGGAGSYKTFDNSSIISDDLVISFIYNAPTAFDNTVRIAYYSTSSYNFLIQGKNNIISIIMANSPTPIRLDTISAPQGTHQIIITLSGSTSTWNIYIDGALNNTATQAIPSFNLSASSTYGADGNLGAFSGTLYDFSFFKLSTLLASGLTEPQIVSAISSNTFNTNSFKYVNEYGIYDRIDGLYQYTYLDSNSQSKSISIAVQGGNIYKDWDTTPVLIYSGLTIGTCMFVTFNDKLYIVNGKDYPLIYNGKTGYFAQMGAPSVNSLLSGALTGTYSYAMTYLTAGGEEVLGTASAQITLSSQKIVLDLPIGYTGTLTRKLYRTLNGGSTYFFVNSIANNTDLTYQDDLSDSALVTVIPAINNECPKPYFIEAMFGRLCLDVVDKTPTQIFIGGTDIELIDSASDSLDTANVSSDNTRHVGMERDYNQLIIGTEKNLILIDPSTTVPTVAFTRSAVGVKNGYSMFRVPANGEFDGGVMFVSTMDDVRLLSGFRNIIPNTVNDISTENWAQVIHGSFPQEINSASIIFAEFYDYKYHLIVDENLYVFDVRTRSWWVQNFKTTNYQSTPSYLANINNKFYSGQTTGWIEELYSTVEYLGEEITGVLTSGQLFTDEKYKFFRDIQFWFLASPNTEVTVTVTTDNDTYNEIVSTFVIGNGYYNSNFFNPIFYEAEATVEDFREFHINRMCRWAKYSITTTSGKFNYRGYKLTIDEVKNKE